jgi:hypothetical protein
MRILRGLSSRFLTCGCLVGVYETYDAEVVNIVDARSSSCTEPQHQQGQTIPVLPRSEEDQAPETAHRV